MIDILSLFIGLAAGAVVGFLVFYGLPYQALRREHGVTQAELAEMQSRNNGLQADLLDVQSTAYQGRQAALQQQKRLEDQLAEAGERHAELEKRIADLEAQHEQEQQTYLREATRLRGAISRLEQEQVALQDRYAQDSTRWDRERQSLGLQTAHMERQHQALQQDKSALGQRLEQQQEAWERERLALQIQLNTLEDNLALQKARSSSGPALAPDRALMVEQARAESAAELKRRQAAWDEERQNLQEQLERLQAERRALREQAATASLDIPSASGDSDLRQQLEQAQHDRQALEEKLAARNLRAEQERGALEAEIEQLMERLLRLQGGRGG
ncbi:MAG: hypothetical protein F9K25_01960 [Candidatus Contendobacter sp.]|nr:MAG: hypothetical protein F9K25_01960 [Candidatus Contendobacter sp.]